MFPGSNPGEWEPVKIRSKITAVSKPRESTPAPVPAPVLVEHKLDQPNGEPPKVEEAISDEKKTEQANGEQLASEDVEMKDKVEQATDQQPKVEQPDSIPSTVEEPKVDPVSSEDIEMKEAPTLGEATQPATQEAQPPSPQSAPGETPAPEALQEESVQPVEEETTETFEDDHWSTEGAVYPIQGGRIENWSCFFALLSHIYNMISPPFHMPVLFVAQPCWSSRDHEMITQYVFENWKIPAFCLMDAALTVTYAYGVPTALVLDVGHGKCDVTAVTEFQVNDVGRGIAITDCGGQAMTKRLQQVLESQGFDEDMAEQLKKSPICEILPTGTAFPKASPNGTAANPAAAASTGALDSGINAKDVDGLRPGQAPRGPGTGTMVGEEGPNGEEEDNEGILDVAAIVARDNAAELLAKREREKAEKAAAKKGGAAEPARPIRMRNSERERASFTYVDYVSVDTLSPNGEPTSRKRKRELEVGVERFMAATPPRGMSDGIIDTIAEAIHHTILSVPDVPQRSTLWENLIIVGNGSRIRGMFEPHCFPNHY